MKHLLWQFGCLIIIALTFSAILTAQSATATLSGTVTDEQGANVSGAVVTIRDAAKAFERRTTSNESGFYNFTQLPPSRYTIRAESGGFSAAEYADLEINVGDQRSLRIKLTVAGIAEAVTVTNELSSVDTSPTVATTINRDFLENLPLNGRSFQSLIQLTPGVVPSAANLQQLGQFSVNGQRESANHFTVDGVGANLGISLITTFTGVTGNYPGFNAQGGTSSLVSVDALQEFKIQTSSFAPEFGRTPGGQISIITRSGTNVYNGTLYEYFRNEKLDANDWFANANGLRKPPLRNNQFGGVFSGPVILPRFGEGGSGIYNGRNKTFFFFSYEGLRLRLPQVAVARRVPTLATRQQATGSIRALLNAFPIPNGQDLGNGFALFSSSYSNPSRADAYALRIDQNIGDKLTVFGRYNRSPSDSATRGSSGGGSVLFKNKYQLETLTLGATMSPTAAVTNDLRVNYSSNGGASVRQVDNFGGATPPSDSDFLPSFASSANTEFSFTVGSGSSAARLALGSGARNKQRQINIVDTLSFIKGNHQIKLGGDYRGLLPEYNYASYAQYIRFSSLAAALSNQLTGADIGATNTPLFPRYQNFSIFGQDTWKVSQRLTLTYGLRWELNPPPTEKNDNGIRAVNGLDNLATMTLAPPGTPLWKTTYNNFAPRVGAAYQMFQKPGRETVLRGGFGVFYDLTSSEVGRGYDAFNYPYSAFKSLQNVPYPLSEANAAPPEFSLDGPYFGIFAFDPKLKLPYTLQWNLTVEQSLGKDQTLSVAYVASAGRRQYRTVAYPEANPDFFAFYVTRNDASSDYHSMQAQFKRRLSKNFQALASYTWSHSIDDLSTDGTNNIPTSSSGAAVNLYRASSDFDRRHSFSTALTYNISVPNTGKFGNAILRNWSVDAIYKALSAAPVDISFYDYSFNGYAAQRPDVVPGVSLEIRDPGVGGGRRYNEAAFALPTTPGNGNFGRNVLRGFPLYQVDLALRRQFDLTERVRLQLRGEAFNLLNRPNFADPDGNLTFGSPFGVSTQMLNRGLGGLNALYQIGGPRSIQLGIKLQF